MTRFLKLHTDKFKDIDWLSLKSDMLLIDSHYSVERAGGSYFYLMKNATELYKRVNDMFTIQPHGIFYCEFTGPDLVSPHRDKMDSVAMNLYLNTDNAVTIYYTENIIDDGSYSIKEIKPYTPNVVELTEVERFIAKPNDLYLLDVNEIHGIQKTSAEARSMITFRWRNCSFNDILNSIKL